MDTKGHLTTNPGLRAHSVDPDNNLMKRFVVAHHKPGTIGWIWERSFDNRFDAGTFVVTHFPDAQWQVIDTADGDRVVAEGD